MLKLTVSVIYLVIEKLTIIHCGIASGPRRLVQINGIGELEIKTANQSVVNVVAFEEPSKNMSAKDLGTSGQTAYWVVSGELDNFYSKSNTSLKGTCKNSQTRMGQKKENN